MYRNLSATFRILLQEVPQNVDVPKLIGAIEALPEVESIHDVHVWSLDGERHIVTMHVVTKCWLTGKGQCVLKSTIRNICKENKIGHATIEFEVEGDECCLSECDL